MMINNNYNTPELIYYHTLGVRLVRYSYATLTLHKRYKYVQNAGHSFVIRWNTSLHVAHMLRVRWKNATHTQCIRSSNVNILLKKKV